MSKIIRLTQLGNIAVIPVKLGEDYDYALYMGGTRYIAKKVNSPDVDYSIVEFVVYNWVTDHRCVGDKFNLTNNEARWPRYRVVDKSSPTIEDIKKHLQF